MCAQRVALLVCFALAVSALPCLKSPRAWVQFNLSTDPSKPVIIELDGENAPVTAANFINLAQNHMYDDTVFHRIVPGFVVQGGDPAQTHLPSNSHSERVASIPLEIRAADESSPHYREPLPSGKAPALSHHFGAVAMARTDDPNSASSQFYFVTGPDNSVHHLDGGYAVFGKVTQGMDVVTAVRPGDFIMAVHVLEPEHVTIDPNAIIS
eukprot:c5686_g1_i2.p1 GENE.c5686_g1_i2~~c5686_g1_i2.p1  ORF type:complete len:210 (+),score=60.47 c5686_g1_i2:61-690(+)